MCRVLLQMLLPNLRTGKNNSLGCNNFFHLIQYEVLFNVRGLITQENSTGPHTMGYLFYCSRKDLYPPPPHRGNFNIIKGAGNNLKMSKGEGRHVDLSFSKGLHTVKSYCG